MWLDKLPGWLQDAFGWIVMGLLLFLVSLPWTFPYLYLFLIWLNL